MKKHFNTTAQAKGPVTPATDDPWEARQALLIEEEVQQLHLHLLCLPILRFWPLTSPR